MKEEINRIVSPGVQQRAHDIVLAWMEMNPRPEWVEFSNFATAYNSLFNEAIARFS